MKKIFLFQLFFLGVFLLVLYGVANFAFPTAGISNTGGFAFFMFLLVVVVLPLVLCFIIYFYRVKAVQKEEEEKVAASRKKAKKVVVAEEVKEPFVKLSFLDVFFLSLILFLVYLGFTNFYTLPEEQVLDVQHMEPMKMEMEMEGMVDLDTLPLEEPQRSLKPEIVYEDGNEIKVFKIWIEAVKKEIRPGVYVEAWGFNRQVPGPELRVQEGDTVRVLFENRHATFNHTIHWHGQHVPNHMDGVPGVTQYEVQPNETFVYEFIAKPSGTHIYHCHVDTDHHIDMGMYGAFIVEAKDEDLSEYAIEETWVLSSFNTKHNPALHTAGPSSYFSGHNQYKVEKDAFLINGKAFPATTPIKVKEGDLVKLRMINIGKEPYSMHLHGHSFIVTHKDGFPVANPQEMDTLPILPGERYDLKIEMKNKGAWVFHDHITQHVTNDGFYPGGMLSMIIYDDFAIPDYLQDHFAKIKSYTKEANRLGAAPETTSSYVSDMSSMGDMSGMDH